MIIFSIFQKSPHPKFVGHCWYWKSLVLLLVLSLRTGSPMEPVIWQANGLGGYPSCFSLFRVSYLAEEYCSFHSRKFKAQATITCPGPADCTCICRPRWLVSKGKNTEALNALGKLRQTSTTDPRIQQEWFDIRAEVAFHKETSALRHPNLQDRRLISRIKLEIVSWLDCFRRGCRRRTFVGVGLMFFQQFVGINVTFFLPSYV